MGTNFYTPSACTSPCEHCTEEGLHIGKRSGGWTFGFQAYPEMDLVSWSKWQEFLKTVDYIRDEYGTRYTHGQFVDIVEKTRKPWGPNKIAPARRDGISPILHKVDERFFVSTDDWDFWNGPFS